MPNDYDLAKQVLKEYLDGLKWRRRQLNDELRDMRNDPEMGRDCPEYKDARNERRYFLAQEDLMERILRDLDDDVCNLKQEMAMSLAYE